MKQDQPVPALDLDTEGFLKNHLDWTERHAVQIAKLLNYKSLSADHWKILYILRDHYELHHTIPNLHMVCKLAQLEHNCVDKLFHNNAIDAWRIAGLPYPGEEIKSYL